MRLTEYQQNAIKETFREHFLEGDQLWLFGSRVDPSRRGGDIDLYVETTCENSAQKKFVFLRDLKIKIGDQKIDLIINDLQSNVFLPIYEEARSTGVQLI